LVARSACDRLRWACRAGDDAPSGGSPAAPEVELTWQTD